ncbi:MAG: dTDP-4-dehydrorhamnose reductase, partial [Candidatus Rokuibacteriota bacterium]
FSTDYVFDGRRATPYLEADVPNPLSVYAESKLAGERLALERCERARVFRVSGLYGVARSSGKGGTNFVETMLHLATEGRPIRVVADQVLGPSYTLDLARKVWQILPLAVHPIYHLTNAGATSWHDFARRVFELAGLTPDLRPVTAAEFGARARRPAYSVLGHGNLTALGADDLRPWEAALAAYVAERASSR